MYDIIVIQMGSDRMIDVCFETGMLYILKDALRVEKDDNRKKTLGIMLDVSEDEVNKEQERLSNIKEMYYHWHQPILKGNPEQVLGICLALGYGNLCDPYDIDTRKQAIAGFHFYEQESFQRQYMLGIGHTLQKSYQDVERLKQYASTDTIRIWVDQTANSQCGLLFVANLLKQYHPNIRVVYLPTFVDYLEAVEEYMCWSECPKETLKRMRFQETQLSEEAIEHFAKKWLQLQYENSDLRANINGQVMSVSEKFYDELLLSHLDHPMRIGQLIFKVCHQKLSLSDTFLFDRIYELLEDEWIVTDEKPPIHMNTVIYRNRRVQ